MSAEAYPIIANPNPFPQKQKKKFLKFAVIPLMAVLVIGGWYLIQNKPWQRAVVKEDPTIQTQEQHGAVWSAFFEFDTSKKEAFVKGFPKKSNADLFVPVITDSPEPAEGEWGFEVVVESTDGVVFYRSYRKLEILPLESNHNIWEFGLAVPYKENSILRLFDLEGNQIFAQNI